MTADHHTSAARGVSIFLFSFFRFSSHNDLPKVLREFPVCLFLFGSIAEPHIGKDKKLCIMTREGLNWSIECNNPRYNGLRPLNHRSTSAIHGQRSKARTMPHVLNKYSKKQQISISVLCSLLTI